MAWLRAAARCMSSMRAMASARVRAGCSIDPRFLYDDASLNPDQVAVRSMVWVGRLVRIGPPVRTRICLSRVLTPRRGETRRRISSTGGVAVVVSRDARLRS
jgi:hypothetical protein